MKTSVSEKNYNCKHMYGIDYGKPGARAFIDSWSSALRNSGRAIDFALSNNLPIANVARPIR